MSCPTDSSSHDSERLLFIAVGQLFSLRTLIPQHYYKLNFLST